MRGIALALLILAAVSSAASAHAQPASKDDSVRARPLALEAVERLKKNDFVGALDLAQQAEAIYHAPTHLLFIGQALEGQGRLAEALSTYERLAVEPLPDGSPAPFQRARDAGKERLRNLVARVPAIHLVVHGAAEGAFTATVDGHALDARQDAVRLDPGEHAVVVEAPGKRTAERKVVLPDKGGVVVVEITLDASEGPTPAVAPTTAPAPPGVGRIPAYVAFGIGGAGLVVGGVAGALGMAKMGDLSDRCPNDRCTPAEQSDIDATKTLGTVSTIGFVAGGVGVAAGIVLLIALPARKSPPGAREARASVTPVASGLRVRF